VNTTTNRTQPVIIGGLVMGVLSALPIINLANVCCCLWVIAGGVTAAYMLQQNQSAPITAGDGALIGLLAGLAGAVINIVVAIPIDILSSPFEGALLERAREMGDAVPPAFRDMVEEAARQRETGGMGMAVVGWFVWFCIMLFIGAIFSTLGGVLGAAIFKKPGRPDVIDVPPTPPAA
jgi:hypothetical protein